MIEWYMLLTPLLLLPIILLFAFVGCAEGDLSAGLFGAAPATRTIRLKYDIPKKSPTIIEIKSTFTIPFDGSTPPASRALTWPPGITTTANDPPLEGLLHVSGPVDCTCNVELSVLGMKDPVPLKHTLKQQSDLVIEFALTYSEFPPPATDYNWNNFNLGPGKNP
jgi:hypothetical protein